MKFDDLYYSLLEDFNIAPQFQNAVQSGPDQGMTSGQPSNTFPSKMETIGGKILPSKKDIKKRKLTPKEKQSKIHRDIALQKSLGQK